MSPGRESLRCRGRWGTARSRLQRTRRSRLLQWRGRPGSRPERALRSAGRTCPRTARNRTGSRARSTPCGCRRRWVRLRRSPCGLLPFSGQADRNSRRILCRWRLPTRVERALCRLPPQSLVQPHHLHGDLDEEPVLLAQVEAGELLDAPQALAQRVRVDEERLRGRADIAAPAQELLERAEERGLALPVVLRDLRDEVAMRVPDGRVE